MQFLKTILNQVAKAKKPLANGAIVASKDKAGHQQRGQAGEAQACAFLQQQGLQLLARNYRTPGRGGGEIDLVMREPDGTLVFVEVRVRSHSDYGGAAASVDRRKQRRILLAAQHYLSGYRGAEPPCRFDVVLIQGSKHAAATSKASADNSAIEWLKAAFDAGGV